YAAATEKAVQRMKDNRQWRLSMVLADTAESVRRQAAERSMMPEQLRLQRLAGTNLEDQQHWLQISRLSQRHGLSHSISNTLGIDRSDPLMRFGMEDFARSQINNPNVDLERRLALARELQAY